MSAIERRSLTPSRVAGSLLDARDPRAAIQAVKGHLSFDAPDVVKLGAAEAAKQLGDQDLASELLETLNRPVGKLR